MTTRELPSPRAGPLEAATPTCNLNGASSQAPNVWVACRAACSRFGLGGARDGPVAWSAQKLQQGSSGQIQASSWLCAAIRRRGAGAVAVLMGVCIYMVLASSLGAASHVRLDDTVAVSTYKLALRASPANSNQNQARAALEGNQTFDLVATDLPLDNALAATQLPHQQLHVSSHPTVGALVPRRPNQILAPAPSSTSTTATPVVALASPRTSAPLAASLSALVPPPPSASATATLVVSAPTQARIASAFESAMPPSSASAPGPHQVSSPTPTSTAVTLLSRSPRQQQRINVTSAAFPSAITALASCEADLSSISVQQAIMDLSSTATDGAGGSRPPQIIWFIRTSTESQLELVDSCSISSALETNPDVHVFILSNSLECSKLGALRDARLHILRYSYASVFARHPKLLAWYTSKEWVGQFEMNNLGNSARLALLADYGGLYLDTDMLSIRPSFHSVTPPNTFHPSSTLAIGNFIGVEDEYFLNNAALAFARGHPFLFAAIDTFADSFRKIWGWNGPRLLTRVYRGEGVNGAFVDPTQTQRAGHANLMIRRAAELYPVHYKDANILFEPLSKPAARHKLSQIVLESRYVHLWNKGTKQQLKMIRHGSGSVSPTSAPLQEVDGQDPDDDGGTAVSSSATNDTSNRSESRGHRGAVSETFNASSVIPDESMQLIEWLMAASCPRVYRPTKRAPAPLHGSAALYPRWSAADAMVPWHAIPLPPGQQHSAVQPTYLPAWAALSPTDLLHHLPCDGPVPVPLHPSKGPSMSRTDIQATIAACVTSLVPKTSVPPQPGAGWAPQQLAPVAHNTTVLQFRCGGLLFPLPPLYDHLLAIAYGRQVQPSHTKPFYSISEARRVRSADRKATVGVTISLWIRVTACARNGSDSGQQLDVCGVKNRTHVDALARNRDDSIVLGLDAQGKLAVTTPAAGQRAVISHRVSVAGGGWHHISIVQLVTTLAPRDYIWAMKASAAGAGSAPAHGSRLLSAQWTCVQSTRLYVDGLSVGYASVNRPQPMRGKDLAAKPGKALAASFAFAPSYSQVSTAQDLFDVDVDAFSVFDVPLSGNGVVDLRNHQIAQRSRHPQLSTLL